jgi:hypothetical protein
MDFEKRCEKSCHVPNLYKIVVSGKLSFEQNLLFSKLTTESTLKKDFGQRKFSGLGHDDKAHLHADLVLLQKEIKNGVITSDVLEMLRAVCSNLELKEFYDLEVVTATFWYGELKCDSVEEWIEKVLSSEGELVFDGSLQSLSDTRNRWWFPIPLKYFIGELVEERKRLKKIWAECTDPVEKERLAAKQNALKLIINVLYWCLTSPYFQIGNAVLADCITARARVEVFKLAKALNLSQTITDGGNYCLTEVFHFKKGGKRPRPSLSVLSSPLTL